jgi:hypothetical protein
VKLFQGPWEKQVCPSTARWSQHTMCMWRPRDACSR